MVRSLSFSLSFPPAIESHTLTYSFLQLHSASLFSLFFSSTFISFLIISSSSLLCLYLITLAAHNVPNLISPSLTRLCLLSEFTAIGYTTSQLRLIDTSYYFVFRLVSLFCVFATKYIEYVGLLLRPPTTPTPLSPSRCGHPHADGFQQPPRWSSTWRQERKPEQPTPVSRR